jgi:hypothetical protein
VRELSVLSALAWAEYLESHAHRIYSAAIDGSADGAREILRHIRRGDLPTRFKAREIQRKCWSGLSTGTEVSDALDLLAEHCWIASEEVPTTQKGGRPTVTFTVNPKALRS